MRVERRFPEFDPTRPNGARMADYLLGGKDNFAADREAVGRALRIAPDLPALALQHRGFLRRAVRYAVRSGIRQLVEIGCGLPTRGYVHEVAWAEEPAVKVAYVDNDPVVVTHAAALLRSEERIAVVQADMRDPGQVLARPELGRVLDLDEPVGVLLTGVLPLITEDETARGTVTGFRDAVPSGSLLALSHGVRDVCPQVTARLTALYQDWGVVQGAPRGNLRSRAEVESFFAGLDVAEPGVVPIAAWRPELAGPDEPPPAADPESVWVVGGVGRRP
jgi:O-methyltransferase involved in polyketide biosynthesis